VDPDGLRFVPLGFPPEDPGSRLTPREILARHKTGLAYAHLLEGFKRHPLLRDARGTVLSMPPIINSEETRVRLETRAFFIDVTGLSRRTVDRALAVICSSLLETLPGIELERVIIENPVAPLLTPDLDPSILRLCPKEAAETLGVELDTGAIVGLLERMGHGVRVDGEALEVRVPAWRNDVMHPVDLIEDIGVAFGYENLPIGLVPTFTVGAARPIEEQAATARRVLVGLGFHQVMTLVLSNEEAAFTRWRLPVDERAVRIENPISTEQTLCRVSVLPGLLETLSINKQHELPQEIFEVGDCAFVDPQAETGATEERRVGVARIGTLVGYTEIRATLDAFVHEMGRSVRVRPVEHPSFLPGRAAEILDAGGRPLGLLGELHPEVILAHGLHHPVAVLELSLTTLMG
jgi:phenylalanyl-tRNA synthetase beta chain